VYLSSNNGNSWVAVCGGLTNNCIKALAISGSNIFAGTYGGGVQKSSDNGSNWTAAGLQGYSVNALAISGSNIFAGGAWVNSVFLSSTNGSSWTAINNGLPSYTNVYAFAISGSAIFAGANSGVYLSSNNGNSWAAVNNGLPTNSVIYILVISGSNIFAGTESGVFLSSNNGSSWAAVNNGLPTNTTVLSLAITGDTLFAGTYGAGVWKHSLSDIITGTEKTINNNESNVMIYPNPAINNIIIESQQPAVIEISNIQWQLIKTHTASSNKISVDISGFARGVYFIKVKTEKGIAVKKFVKE